MTRAQGLDDDLGPSLPPHRWAGRRAVSETVVVNGLLAALGVVTGIAAARLLGPEGRGALALSIAVAGITGAVLGLGLQQAFAYIVAARRGAAREAVSLSVWGGASMGGSCIAGGWVLVPVFVRDPGVVTVIRIGLLSVPASLISGNLTGVLQGLRLGRRFNATRLLPTGTYALGLVGAAIAADHVTARAVSTIYVLSVVVSGVTAYYLLSPPLRRLRLPSWRFVTSALRYGVVVGVGGIALMVNKQLALPVLGVLQGLRETGFYAIGLSYATPVGLVAVAIALHTLPDIAAAGHGERASLIRQRIGMTVASLLPLAIVAVLVAPALIPAAFGAQFRPAVPAAQLLVVAQAFSAFVHVLAEIGRGIGRPGLPALAEAAGVGGTVGLLPLVVPKLGIEGAALVSIGVAAGVSLVLAIGVRRELHAAV